MRRVVAVFAAGVTVAGTLLALGSVQSAEAARPQIKVKVTATKVHQTMPVTVKGKVAHAHGRTKVTVQRQKGKRGKWRKEARTPLAGNGTFVHYATPNTPGRVRYRIKAGRTTSRPTRWVKVVELPAHPATVTVTSAEREIDAGGTLDVRGTTSSNLIGKPVTLDLKNPASGVWSTIATTTVLPGGTFSLAGVVTTPGRGIVYRVAAPAGPGVLGALSLERSVNVYTWYRLSTMTASPALTNGPVTLGGAVHPASVSTSGTVAAFYTLGGHCTRFRALVGVVDQGSSTSRYNVGVHSAGKKLWGRDGIAVGRRHPVDVDITRAPRIRLGIRKVSGATSVVGWGDARVRCAR